MIHLYSLLNVLRWGVKEKRERRKRKRKKVKKKKRSWERTGSEERKEKVRLNECVSSVCVFVLCLWGERWLMAQSITRWVQFVKFMRVIYPATARSGGYWTDTHLSHWYLCLHLFQWHTFNAWQLKKEKRWMNNCYCQVSVVDSITTSIINALSASQSFFFFLSFSL